MNRFDDPSKIPDWFWDILERAQKDRNKLKAILMGFDLDALKRFEHQYNQAATYLRRDPWYVYLGVIGSEDAAEDITSWVVGQGKEYFMDIWNHPELIPLNEEGDPVRALYNVSTNVCWEKFGDVPNNFWSPLDEDP